MKRLLTLVALPFLMAQGCSAVYAGETHNPGPLTEYCERVKDQLVKKCVSQFSWKPELQISLALDQSGKIVDQSQETSVDKQKAESIIKSAGPFPAPPDGTKCPIWLSMDTSNDPEKIEVSVRSVEYGPYMAALQRKMKSCWTPPREPRSLHTTISFVLYCDGKISGLKVKAGSGVDETDKAAIDAVNKAVPFSRLPDGSPMHVDIEFTFDYNHYHGDKSGTGVPGQ